MTSKISYPDIAAWMHRVTEPAVHSAIHALQLPAGSRGLDAGCGIGTHTLWLARATSPGGHVTGDNTQPELHILRALDWLQEAGVDAPQVRTFVADIHAPSDGAARDSLTGSFQMLWGKAEPEAAPEDWARFQQLCQPESPGFVLNLPDYYAFITYSLFWGRIAD